MFRMSLKMSVVCGVMCLVMIGWCWVWFIIVLMLCLRYWFSVFVVFVVFVLFRSVVVIRFSDGILCVVRNIVGMVVMSSSLMMCGLVSVM